jgi:hypothetical protein
MRVRCSREVGRFSGAGELGRAVIVGSRVLGRGVGVVTVVLWSPCGSAGGAGLGVVFGVSGGRRACALAGVVGGSRATGVTFGRPMAGRRAGRRVGRSGACAIRVACERSGSALGGAAGASLGAGFSLSVEEHEAPGSSKHCVAEPVGGRLVGVVVGGGAVGPPVGSCARSAGAGCRWPRRVRVGWGFSLRRWAVGVAVCGCMVGACGTARKPLAALGLGPGGRPAGARRARWWRRSPPCQPHPTAPSGRRRTP